VPDGDDQPENDPDEESPSCGSAFVWHDMYELADEPLGQPASMIAVWLPEPTWRATSQ
jgi:hypothetical protein